jgi:hypothetical protein
MKVFEYDSKVQAAGIACFQPDTQIGFPTGAND